MFGSATSAGGIWRHLTDKRASATTRRRYLAAQGVSFRKLGRPFETLIAIGMNENQSRCPARRVALAHPVQVLQARQAHLESFPAS